MFCRYCGTSNPDDSVLCAGCGKPLAAPVEAQEPAIAPAALANAAPAGDSPAPAPAAPAEQLELLQDAPRSAPHPHFPAPRKRHSGLIGWGITLVLAVGLVAFWIYLANRPLVLRGHSQAVDSVAFSPDGHTLASGSADKTIRLWDPASGQYLRTLSGEPDTRWVVFSPDGRLIASSGSVAGNANPLVVLWDVGSGEELHAIAPFQRPQPRTATRSGSAGTAAHQPWISQPVFSPDARLVAAATGTTGLADSLLQFWFTVSGDQALSVAGYRGPLAFGADGKILAAAGDRAVVLLDASSGHALRTLADQPPQVQSMVFSLGGALLAAASGNVIRIFDVASGDPLRTMADVAAVHAIALSPDAHTLASADEDHTVKLWDVATGKLLRTLSGHSAAVNCVAFDPNGQQLASGSDDATIRIWKVPAR